MVSPKSILIKQRPVSSDKLLYFASCTRMQPQGIMRGHIPVQHLRTKSIMKISNIVFEVKCLRLSKCHCHS